MKRPQIGIGKECSEQASSYNWHQSFNPLRITQDWIKNPSLADSEFYQLTSRLQLQEEN